MLEKTTKVEDDPLYDLLNTSFTLDSLRESYPGVVADRLIACRAPGWQALQNPEATKEELVAAIVAGTRCINAKLPAEPDSNE